MSSVIRYSWSVNECGIAYSERIASSPSALKIDSLSTPLATPKNALVPASTGSPWRKRNAPAATGTVVAGRVVVEGEPLSLGPVPLEDGEEVEDAIGVEYAEVATEFFVTIEREGEARPSDSVIVAGAFSRSIDFGSGAMESAGGQDVFFDIFTTDEGWTDPKSIWEIDRKNLPDGFADIRKIVEPAGAKLGLWMSPSGLYPRSLDYDWAEQNGFVVLRYKPGQSQGFRTGVSLADPKYRNKTKLQLQRLIREEGFVQIKYDGFTAREERLHHEMPGGDDSVEPLAAHCLELIQASVSKRARLELYLAEKLSAVQGDATQFRQVVMNLVINGGEALGDGDRGIAGR